MRTKMLQRLDAVFFSLFGEAKTRRHPKMLTIAGLTQKAAASDCGARASLAAIFDSERVAAQRAQDAGDVNWRGSRLIVSAQALWGREPRPRYVRAIIERLKHAPSRSERMEAAAALARMPTPEAEGALVEALDDGDAMVRHHAACALLAMHGVDVDARPIQNIGRLVAEAERLRDGEHSPAVGSFAARAPVRRRRGL